MSVILTEKEGSNKIRIMKTTPEEKIQKITSKGQITLPIA